MKIRNHGVSGALSAVAVWAASLLLALPAAAVPLGIVVTKQSPSHPDGSATVFEYESVKQNGEVTIYRKTDGAQVRLTNLDFQLMVDYPDFKGFDIVTEDDLKEVRRKLDELKKASATYRNAAQALKPHIADVERVIQRATAGEVFFRGGWWSRADYEAEAKRLKGAKDREAQAEKDEEAQRELAARRAAMENRYRKK